MRHTAKQAANPWRTEQTAILVSNGGLSACYFKPIYRAKYYSANPWRPAWRPDPSLGGLTLAYVGRPPGRHRRREWRPDPDSAVMA